MKFAFNPLILGVLLTLVPYGPGLRAAPAPAANAPAASQEIVDAIKSLKTADSAGRKKVFDLLAEKGDARLIPALKAYKDGSLLLVDGKLVLFGERVNIPGKGSVLPLLDALGGQNVIGPDGQPIYFPKPDLSKAIKAPPRTERGAVVELISSLSLLDPDPVARLASIRDVSERAARALPDPADATRFLDEMTKCMASLNARLTTRHNAPEAPTLRDAVAAMAAAAAEHPASATSPAPGDASATAVKSALRKAQDAIKQSTPIPPAGQEDPIATTLTAASAYQDRLEMRKKILDELPKIGVALRRQLDKDPNGPFAAALHEAIDSIDLVIGDPAAQLAAAKALGGIATGRAANLLRKAVDVAGRSSDSNLHAVAADALHSADRYQTEVHFIQNTFAGLSSGSILVLLALGLSIIFGLMGVINMAHGEFMMVGAFTTYVVAEAFKAYWPGAYEFYLLAAIPAAFIVAGGVGFIVEWLVIRHLYGRPLETLLATWGIGLVLIQAVRLKFGDTLTVSPPKWMEGGYEVAPDIVFPLNRLFIIGFCALCIAVVYFMVNRTKLGLMLRATTQNREMAAALGVATRRVDGFTFALGTGLAGLAGVVVPLYNKINPSIGQEYTVDCFMVVVVGGVGKLAGAIWAGLSLGFIGKYIEALLGQVPWLASGASVIGKVLVLVLIIVFLQRRPQGLFPPKGRLADA
ncbi:MAG TPA: urea ABC transporter permease subunit UrtB [Tepidisphaeraceae bacterium]|nr:urea ABC transporter permease subunit UrtB [Tepidisphaeraceae bacterium]